MKKEADNTKNITVNVNLFSNINLDGKSLLYITIVILCLTLVVSICDPSACAELIRFLISMAIDC